MWEENFGTQAGARLIEGVRLIRGPLNTGFTVFETVLVWCNIFIHDRGAEGKRFKSTSKTFHRPPFVSVDFRL